VSRQWSGTTRRTTEWVGTDQISLARVDPVNVSRTSGDDGPALQMTANSNDREHCTSDDRNDVAGPGADRGADLSVGTGTGSW
jgi:hypothetical protein